MDRVDGSSLQGLVLRFDASAADVLVATPDGERRLVPAEAVGSIRFLDTGQLPGVPARGAPSKQLRIHMAGGRTAVVWADLSAVSHPVGFFGVPQDDPAEVAIFFYAHAINAREETTPLGGMLVEAGHASGAAVQIGLAEQMSLRTVPIGRILAEQRRLSLDVVEQAALLQKRRKLRLGEVLVEAGLVSEADVEAALCEQQSRRGKRIGEILLDMGIVTELDLTLTLSKKFHVPFVDLDRCTIDDQGTSNVVSTETIEKYGVLPIEADARTLTIAISDPLATEVVDLLRLHTKRRIQEVLATPSQLRRYTERLLRARRGSPADAAPVLATILRDLDAAQIEVETEEDEVEPSDVAPRDGDRGVVALVSRILVDAVTRGASDVHIEPNGRDRPVLVRLRIDGECEKYAELPGTLRAEIVARIKIMARLDIAERRKPQDGKIRFRVADRLVELRVATLPTVNGNEDVTMRVLAPSKPVPLDRMDLSARNLTALRALLTAPHGLLLCVGPTGSGKTTTLHSALGVLNDAGTKIWTAEDPVEITQPGLRQVQMLPKAGVTFATTLRAFLRADPDVIMVGEMRDEETATIAVEASLTGHLVLSTLHTNSAADTITRLLDMGVDPFSFGDALLGVLAQRLARRLCGDCARYEDATANELEEMASLCRPDVWSGLLGAVAGRPRTGIGVGCNACGGSGYRGRIALHELLVSSDDTRAAISRRAPAREIGALARQDGMTSLVEDGVWKCLQGRTDLRQVLAVARCR